MFDKPTFVLYCCTTPKFEETKNNLLKYVLCTEQIINDEHIQEKHFI